jgi:hypothetical protein
MKIIQICKKKIKSRKRKDHSEKQEGGERKERRKRKEKRMGDNDHRQKYDTFFLLFFCLMCFFSS